MAMAYESLGEAAKARILLEPRAEQLKSELRNRVNGEVRTPPTDWAPGYVYLREAEASDTFYDPVFPSDLFAR